MLTSGGETGIRTLGTRESTTVFETAPFDHSGISPHSLALQACSQGACGLAFARRAPVTSHHPACQAPDEHKGTTKCGHIWGRFSQTACFARAKSHILAPMERSHFFSSQAGRTINAPRQTRSRFGIGEVVRHRLFDFRGVVFDIDPVFANSEEWYEAIPEDMRPPRDQPFYHLLAENEESSYVAYVSQGNLVSDSQGGPVDHPTVPQLFEQFADGRYRMRRSLTH